MPRILVRPDQLRALGTQLLQVSGDLRGVEGRVSSALGGLGWEARQKAGVDGQTNQARSQARSLAAQAEEMSRYLTVKAQVFEEADRVGANGIVSVVTVWTKWQADYRAAMPSFDQVRDSAWWRQMKKVGWHTRFWELDYLKFQAEQEDKGFTSPLARIRDLDGRTKELEQQREALQKRASGLLNQVIPELPLRKDKDGLPWRVKSDTYEEQVARLDAEINRLSELKQKYTRYYLLDDLIKQGIPEDGPSMPKRLYGCTYYAATRRNVDSWNAWGDGGAWGRNGMEAGWEVGRMPVKGSLVSFRPGACYYDESKGKDIPLDAAHGHVAYVERVDYSKPDVVRIEISEGNNTGVVGPGNVQKNFWVTISKDEIDDDGIVFIYGPDRPPEQMYSA